MQIDLNTRIIDLTLGEVIEFLKSELNKPEPSQEFTDEDCIFGLNGLAKHLNCSKTWANHLKQSGKIDNAIIQTGRKIIISKAKLMECLK